MEEKCFLHRYNAWLAISGPQMMAIVCPLVLTDAANMRTKMTIRMLVVLLRRSIHHSKDIPSNYIYFHCIIGLPRPKNK